MMIVVRFNDPEEYLAELGHDCERIDRGIVRLTQSVNPIAQPPIRHLSVVATARVGDTVVRLECFCGELWGKEFPQDAETVASAKAVMKRIEEACQALELEVRAGIFEPCV
jgi:hypothetical protein